MNGFTLFLAILSLLLSAAGVVGLVFLTKFAFKSQTAQLPHPVEGTNSMTCVENFDKNKVRWSKTTVILMWSLIAISMIMSFLNFARGRKVGM